MKRLTTLLVICSAILFSSCAASGYGCKGRASWNDVIRKANKLY